MKIMTYLILMSFGATITHAQFNGMLAEVPGHQCLFYTQFILSYNEDHEQADWVYYELTGAEAQMSEPRCDCFTTDQDVLTGSANHGDYTSTGFDRGHLSPAADNNISAVANAESFLFSNMSPQLPDFNREIWADLEAQVRDWAIQHDTIYVATGPVFVNNLGKIGNNEVTIPGYFYKCVLRFDGTTARSIAFLMPQQAHGDIRDYVVTVNSVETLTGLDFFPELPSSSENRVESQFETTQWGF